MNGVCPGESYISEVSCPWSISVLYLCDGNCECQCEPKGKCLIQQTRLERGIAWQEARKAGEKDLRIPFFVVGQVSLSE